jgi:two-component system response regulator PilR (NtrC family)
MESEFFGHLKGSFTGASADNDGLFKAAQGGTLFLDEIADLPLAMQVKLLRVIQEKTIRAIGSQQEQAIDVRIISASHKDLETMVKQGDFRQDLYYRVNVIGISVPTLSERSEDIPDLASYLIKSHNRQNAGKISIGDEAMKALQAYSFPGNVRELENVLERASALCENENIEPGDLQLPQNESETDTQQTSLGEMTKNMEKEHIISALESNRWNQSATARALGLTLRQLRYRIDKLKLNKN